MKFSAIHFLRIGFLLISVGSLAQSKSPDVAAIRSLRAQSNQAIEARDLTAFGQRWLPHVEVTRGSGSHVSGRDSVLASVAVQFKDPNFQGYVRDTDCIQVSTSGPLAAEQGRWTGRFQRPDGMQIITGTYLAMWRKLTLAENSFRAFREFSLHRKCGLREVRANFIDQVSFLNRAGLADDQGLAYFELNPAG